MVVYQRVHDEILQALKDNVYPVGTLLPPEPELERIYFCKPHNCTQSHCQAF